MQKQLIGMSSPFLHNEKSSTTKIMGDVIIALMPAAFAAVWYFGADALKLILISVIFAVGSEWIYEKLTHQKSTIGDLSAVVTGLLLAYNIPSNAPWWIAAIGSVLAIVLVKQIFGGIGQNFMNPALAGRTILMLSWTALMAATAAPCGGQLFGLGETVDAVASSTPLMAEAGTYTLTDLFLGNVPGMLGETSKLALLLGGLYLIIRGVIDWRVPVTYIATVFVLFFVQNITKASAQEAFDATLYQVLSGGLFLGAFFMATDYVTCPMTKWGRVIMGFGCGFILWVIRAFGGYPEGCSFGILFMNVMTPLVDKWTMSETFGAQKPAKKGGSKA